MSLTTIGNRPSLYSQDAIIATRTVSTPYANVIRLYFQHGFGYIPRAKVYVVAEVDSIGNLGYIPLLLFGGSGATIDTTLSNIFYRYYITSQYVVIKVESYPLTISLVNMRFLLVIFKEGAPTR